MVRGTLAEKWQYYYSEESLRRQETFFQKFLKGQPSDVNSWPPVVIEIRDQALAQTRRDEKEWPLARTKFVRKYPDQSTKKLVDEPPLHAAVGSYVSMTIDDKVHFMYTLPKRQNSPAPCAFAYGSLPNTKTWICSFARIN